MTTALQKKICKVILWIAFFNFMSLFIESAYFGGDAGNGFVRDGKYYLGNHGNYVETSKFVFTYSLWHVRSMFLTSVLAAIGLIWHHGLVDEEKA